MKMDASQNDCNGHSTDDTDGGHSTNNELLTLLSQLTQFDDVERFFVTLSGDGDGVELPKSLIITNLDIHIFRDEASPERVCCCFVFIQSQY